MNKLLFFVGVSLMTICSAARAQERMNSVDYIPEVSLDARGGYYQNFTEGTGNFLGYELYLDISGQISPSFSYSFNHKIASSYYGEMSGFDATNWLTLTYSVGDFEFTAGKDALLVGSFEYDASDIDSYYDMNSMFYNVIDCWQWGVYATWYLTENNSISFQFANSPHAYGEPNMFAYNLAWRSEWDFYESYWTVNLWEDFHGFYTKSLNLGNRFHFGDFSFDLDCMVRAKDLKTFFNEDITLHVAPSYYFTQWGKVFAKFGWEQVGYIFDYDFVGSNLYYGAGLEFFPIKGDEDLRFHIAWSSNSAYTQGHTLNLGVTWKMNFTKAVKNLFLNRE